MTKIKTWQTMKGFAGLQFRDYEEGRTWRQTYRNEAKKQVVDYFGVMKESEAKKIAMLLNDNRKKNIGAQSFAEMQAVSLEKEKAQDILDDKERKRLIQEKAFADSNTILTYFEKEYWPRVSKKRAETTNNNMMGSFKKWILSHLGDIPIIELTRQDIQKMLDAMDGHKPRNVQYVFNLLKHLYTDAIDFFAESDTPLKPFPATKIKLEVVNNEKTCFLSVEEAHELLELLYNWTAYCNQNKIVIKKPEQVMDAYGMSLISLLTGLRFSSVAKLKWHDINNGLAYIRNTKNKKALTVNVSHELIQNMLENRQKLSENDYIFTNSLNEPYKQIPRIFYKAVKILGFNDKPHRRGNEYERIDFHALRHTYASWLAAMRTTSFEIKELMGHSTLKMTERYARLNPDAVQKKAFSLAQAFAEKKEITS